ncbi:MAG: cell wall hydrolase [Clostridiaceae bacterium]
MKKLMINLFFYLTIFTILLLPHIAYANPKYELDKELFENKETTKEVFNVGSSIITDADIYLMSQVVTAESRSEPYEGKVAVASVILNRVESKSFPKTVESVIKEENAFSCIIDNEITCKPDADSINAVYDALRGYDPSKDSLFFYNPEISTSPWMDNAKKDDILKIGNHLFFRIN